MLKHGPKDTCWAATYRLKDEELLKKYFIKSATLGRENNPMIIQFFDQLEKKWNDHIGILEIDSQKFEIIEIAKTSDIPTIQGLQHCCRQIMTAGLPLWKYHGVGSSTLEPRTYQQRLYGEIEPRIDMSIAGQGSITRVNQSMRTVATFPSTFPTITVRESAIFTNSTGYTAGIMLNRQVFASNPIGHTVNVNPFTVGTDINFASETKWG
jgi:thiol-disulfide isomerase/thioredoxin